jgi:hypothetical protein
LDGLKSLEEFRVEKVDEDKIQFAKHIIVSGAGEIEKNKSSMEWFLNFCK